jgi:hypothetical protein
MAPVPPVALLGSRPTRPPSPPSPAAGDPPGTGTAPLTAPNRAALVVLAVAVGITGYGLARHAMWFDELQAWNIARASRSLPQLFQHLRDEGHPGAWYLLLFGLTRLTGDPRVMQAAELVIVASTYAVVLFASPFSKPLRYVLLAGYTISFEYGIITRAYGLGVLALVVTLALLGRPRPRWSWALLSLAVLAWTSVAGAVLALAVAAAVADPRGVVRRPASRPARDRRRFVIGTVVAAVGAVVSCIPPGDFHAFTPSVASPSTLGPTGGTRLLTAATGTWRGLVPIPSRLGAWNSQFLDRLPAAAWIEAGLSVGLVVLMAGALRRAPAARRLWLLGSIGLFGFFTVVVVPDQARYAAPTFLLFLGAAWWALAPPGAPAGPTGTTAPAGAWPTRRLGQLVTVVVAAQVVALVAIAPSETTRRFAPNQASADTVRAAGLQDQVVSGEDFDATSVAAYLDQPVYSVARGAWIRFFVHDDREARRDASLRTPEVLCAARSIARATGRAAAVITERPPTPAPPGVTPLAHLDRVDILRVAPDTVLAGCPDHVPAVGPGPARAGTVPGSAILDDR